MLLLTYSPAVAGFFLILLLLSLCQSRYAKFKNMKSNLAKDINSCHGESRNLRVAKYAPFKIAKYKYRCRENSCNKLGT